MPELFIGFFETKEGFYLLKNTLFGSFFDKDSLKVFEKVRGRIGFSEISTAHGVLFFLINFLVGYDFDVEDCVSLEKLESSNFTETP